VLVVVLGPLVVKTSTTATITIEGRQAITLHRSIWDGNVGQIPDNWRIFGVVGK
jgi:hypothetical protein